MNHRQCCSERRPFSKEVIMLFDSMGGGAVFRPDELKLVQSAFDDAVLAMALYLRPDQLDKPEIREIIAEAIMKAATAGCRDREALRNFGLAQVDRGKASRSPLTSMRTNRSTPEPPLAARRSRIVSKHHL
jgi:hypothetical protein